MITPYKRRPDPPVVALLTREGDVIDEHGQARSLGNWPDELRCWCDYDTVRQLIADGYGEALCWNGEEITWRHKRLDQTGWKRRPSDVHVIKLPFHEQDELTIGALAAWRDWLAGYGASPTSTTGSASWSLLRATLEDDLWLSMGAELPLKQTMGGRQELGPRGQGRFDGDLAQLDLPAAYASELGNLPYGGHWHRLSDLAAAGSDHEPAWWAEQNRPVFVNAVVSIPKLLPYGPLPRRPRRRLYGAYGMDAEYPVGCRLQGTWTWQELEAAVIWGCRLISVREGFVHLAGGRQPFHPWWLAVLEGRRMPGLAGLLAKTTGNALWGRFAMDPRNHGERKIRHRGKSGRLVSRPLPFQGGRPATHDLAETVSGRIRARGFDAMMRAGDNLLSYHTDGFWCDADPALLDSLPDWRRKQEARTLEILGPQSLRYWPRRGAYQTVMSGVEPARADEMFDRAWSRTFPGQEEAAA